MKIKRIKENRIIFDNDYILRYEHEQDCCENVYADFEVLKNYNVSTVTGKNINIKDIDFNEELKEFIESVKGLGFNMISKIGEKFFVPCYNIQNGYYNNQLELELYDNKGNLKFRIDISECTFDDDYDD